MISSGDLQKKYYNRNVIDILHSTQNWSAQVYTGICLESGNFFHMTVREIQVS